MSLAPDRGDGRKVHYGSGVQPLDTMLENGWAAHFAAGSIVKYLRRDKAKEHSLESARFYYKLIVDKSMGLGEPFSATLIELLHTLTPEEYALIEDARPLPIKLIATGKLP